MKFKGNLLGKRVFEYDPEIECSESDVEQFLSKFNRLFALRKIGDLAKRLFEAENDFIKVNSIPIHFGVLEVIALKVIKYSDDENLRRMNKEELSKVLRMGYKLFNDEKKSKRYKEIIMRFSYKQFIYQENNFNLAARNFYIYKKLWYQVDKAKDLDVLKEIQESLGISYDLLILFTYALIGQDESFVFPYNKRKIQLMEEEFSIEINEDSHKKYLDWCSGDYEGIIKKITDLNPFLLAPIVETKTTPPDKEKEAYIIISPELLFQKITKGIYFLLADKFNMGGNENKFKEKFGYVFEEYIGELLKYHFDMWDVSSEIRYDTNRDTIDWFVIKDEKALLIEVKQSSIFLEAKQTGNISEIESDLEKTLLKGAKQLKRTKADVKSNNYPNLSALDGVKNFEMVIVVNDPLYNANLVGKEMIENKVGISDFTIININDFETLLAAQQKSENLFNLLKTKNDSEQYKFMDIKEYMVAIFEDETTEFNFLKKKYENFFPDAKS